MVRIGGANEMIISDAAGIPGRSKYRADSVGISFGIDPLLFCRLSNLIAMLIGARQKVNLIACRTVIASQCVR